MSGMRLLRAGLLSLRLRHTPLTKAPVVGYRTKGGHDVAPELYPDTPDDHKRGGRARRVQRAEELEDEYNIENPNFFSDSHSDEIRRQKRVKFKIIERKYFKPPQETNLLTWDAKEQMRYLHQEFPEEWTVERLAESFPTSREGVINILKSSWKPTTLREVVKHDRRVQKAWLALTDNNTRDGPDGPIPLQSRYQKLLEDGRLAQAAGIRSLPAPTSGRLLTDAEAAIPPRLPLPPDAPLSREKKKGNKKYTASVGPFESLVKDYCERKEGMKAEPEPDAYIGYEKHRKESIVLLQQVVVEKAPMLKSSKPGSEMLKQLSGGPLEASLSFDRQGMPGRPLSERAGRSLFDHIQEKEAEMAFSNQAEAILRGDVEIPDNEEGMITLTDRSSPPILPNDNSYGEHKKGLRRRRSKTNVSLTNNSLDRRLEKLQMEGTGKITPENTEREISEDRFSDDEYNLGRGRVKQYKLDEEKANVLSRMRYDTPRKGTAKEEAYIYTEGAGYQYPLGRTDESLKVDIPRRREDEKSKVYQKGKAVYDESGELLYRIT